MIRLPDALRAWNSPQFETVLKQEIGQLDAAQLPLQQGLKASSQVADDQFTAMLLSAADATDCIRAKVGIFYHGLITGCSCADDPTPIEAQNEYCELIFAIDKATAETSVMLNPE